MTTDSSSLRELPLAATHVAAGARMMPLAGWRVPAHFGDPEAEYAAAQQTVAVMDTSFLTVVTARGRDHVEYLNRRLSQRVIDQQPGEVARANQLNGEGRMEADLLFARVHADLSLLLATPFIGGEYLQNVADKYVFAEAAVFEDATAAWGSLTLIGPATADLCARLGISAPAAPRALASSTPPGLGTVHALHNDFIPGGLTLLVAAESLAALHRLVSDQAAALGGRAMGFLAFESLRVEAGTPWWGIDLNDRSIPLEADLMVAIHTNKGCYPGQETIAKILNLGHPARKLVGVRWQSEEPLAAGAALTVEGAAAGTLTSTTYSPRLGCAIGLAMVRWPHRTPGTPVQAGEVHGQVVALPFQ